MTNVADGDAVWRAAIDVYRIVLRGPVAVVALLVLRSVLRRRA